MSSPTNYFKIGLFVLLGLAAAFATAVAFGANQVERQTLAYYTYFNESVQGLDVGSPVKYRGVTIGTVAAIEIAPDRRHVQVGAELDLESIRRLGLTETAPPGEGGPVRFSVPPELRTQLQSQGITGVKFLALDFFDLEDNPLPQLPFETPANYIPAAPSLMKSLEDSIVRAADSLPVMATRISSALDHIDTMLAQLQQENLAGRTVVTLTNVNDTLAELKDTVKRINQANIPEKAAGTLVKVDSAVARLDGVLRRFDGDSGLVASATRATDAFGEVGRSAHGTTRELDTTLREFRETIDAVRDLVESLEKDPDMLLKGRAVKEAP
ncbi:MlaD family protein [Sorangium sp. So ce1389]|uniref:MlaD family protein n=1 Tax=Sorangium sp. So ce1389 TaxID=3133336 RepID=UPI003F5E0340